MRTFIGNYPETLTEDEVVKNAASYLDICGEIAEAKGVVILIETHDAFSTGKKINLILDRIRKEGVAVLWDIHHTINLGERPEETYKEIEKSIKHVHIKDALGDKLCLTGKGILPIKEIIQLLRSKKYAGYLSLEWEKTWVKELEDPEIAFPQFLNYMKTICH